MRWGNKKAIKATGGVQSSSEPGGEGGELGDERGRLQVGAVLLRGLLSLQEEQSRKPGQRRLWGGTEQV